jgi:enhancing lycopene biosynthesis protein 2
VYDGSEIHEAVFTLLAICEQNAEAVCYAPDVEQYHVVNHLTGDEMDEKRNVLVESARIARGDIRSLADFSTSDLDALILPGGFGAAKNLTEWAFKGPDGKINSEVRKAIVEMVQAGKPVGGLCMGPTVIAKALEGTDVKPELTVGTTKAPSPYDIAGVSQGMEKTGALPVMKTIEEVAVDEKNKIVTAPCYMMQANILQVRENVKKAVEALIGLVG